MKINRRNFMKMLAVVPAAIGLSKAESAPSTPTAPSEPIEPQKKYDLIADLVEEMNKYDKKFPEQNVKYYIHCSYTGLAFLYETGLIKREYYDDPSIKHPFELHAFDMKVSYFVPVAVMTTKSDLALIGRTTEKCSFDINAGIHNHRYRYELVTTRCFNVNREEEGKIIEGDLRPLGTHKELYIIDEDGNQRKETYRWMRFGQQ